VHRDTHVGSSALTIFSSAIPCTLRRKCRGLASAHFAKVQCKDHGMYRDVSERYRSVFSKRGLSIDAALVSQPIAWAENF
jgi:hypothetical protein